MKTWVRHRFAILALFVVFLTAITAGVWRAGYGQALDQLAQRGAADLALASDRLTAQLQRYQELAVLMAGHPILEALPKDGTRAGEATSLLLEAADKTAALDLAYVDINGRVLASAQKDVTASLSGTPYFERALHGALGAHHGVDARTGRRAFYFASPSFGTDGRVSGVLVVTVDIENVEWNWRGDRPAVYFVDEYGVVFISNRSELLFWERRTGAAAIVPRQGRAPEFQSYARAGHTLWRLDWGPYLPKRGMHLVKPLPVIGLRGEAVIDVAPAVRLAALQAAMVAALILFSGVLLYQAMLRRQVLAQANAVLEERVSLRTKALLDTNTQLRREISEREDAEAALKKAQADLVQAGKLSALGQMSAGISHEWNQPLMAIQQYSENGTLFLERGKTDIAADNLGRISAMATRMGRIIRNLRAFARNESEPIGRVDIVSVITAALELSETRFRQNEIVLEWTPPETPIWVRGGEVRLGQVMVNLIANAVDAMAESTPKVLSIKVTRGARARISVRDTGPGIQEPEKMFDPFFSTKAIGSSEGMGLGLSISYGLVQSFGGQIRGANAIDSGAIFTVELDYWTEEQAA